MEFEQLDDVNHVFSIEQTNLKCPNNSKIHKTSELTKFALAQLIHNSLGSLSWETGVEGELLKLGSSNWIKGSIRLRVVIDFRPDEPEPPTPPKTAGLEEFRQ